MLILSDIVLVEELECRVEPAPQLTCAVVIDLGRPNLPSGDDIVEIRAEPLLGICFGFAGPLVDMRSKTYQVLPHLFAEHNELRTAFEPLRQLVVEVSRAAVLRGGGKPVGQFSEVVRL